MGEDLSIVPPVIDDKLEAGPSQFGDLRVWGYELNADPLWTASGSWTMGRDPLGLQATSIRLYQQLVPGITNITNRLRYYSYYPWIIRLYERTEHSDSSSKWATFVRRADALYALASMVVDPDHSDGLGGWDWANGHRQDAAENGIDLGRFADDPKSDSTYLQALRGTFGAAYAPTFIDLGLTTASSVPVTIGRGNELADAFAKSVGPAAEFIQEALQTGHVRADELKLIGEAIHPSGIPEGSDELQLLREFLGGAWQDDPQGETRRSTAWLLLDAYRQGVTPGDAEQLRTLWYDRLLPNNAPYDQAGSTIDRWRAYQANEYCHVALECVLNGLVGSQAEDHPDGIEPRGLVAELVAESLADAKGTWTEWALEIADDLHWSERQLGSVLLEAIRRPERPTPDDLFNAFRLLALLWVRWSSGDGDVRKIISITAGRTGRSLDGVFRTLDENAEVPVGQAVAALLQRHIIIDHQTIAGHKLSSAGTFTYHFMVADGLLTDGEVGAYTYTTPRLSNFTRLLRDAKLIDGDALTAAGEAFVEAHQPL